MKNLNMNEAGILGYLTESGALYHTHQIIGLNLITGMFHNPLGKLERLTKSEVTRYIINQRKSNITEKALNSFINELNNEL